MEQKTGNNEEETYPEEVRFEMDANDYETVLKYFRNRATQLLASGDGVVLKNIPTKIEDWGVLATFSKVDNGIEQEYHAVYVLYDHRGKGHYPKWIAANPGKVIFTVEDCQLEEFLKNKGIPHKVGRKPSFPEYQMIEQFYGNKIARRSRVHLINHIDEGLYILHVFGASEYAKRAYAIHPILQMDPDIKAFWENDKNFENINPRVLLLAVEYRNIANGYLSFMPSRPEVKLSPIDDVNKMLIADKIQNRKDFENYHLGTHAKSERLKEYFSQWLTALGVTEAKYQEVKKDILTFTSQVVIP